jgi:DNA transposition AAA+ family ATPase
MAENNRHHNGIALLRNVMSMVTLVQRVVDRTPTLPGMAVYYGHSGYGKSTAATYAANTFDAYYVELQSTWTKKTFCEAILKDLGIPPASQIADMVNQIAREIASTGRPLLIDEADYLVERGFVELVRDIYQASEGSIILIGEEKLPQKLMRWERVHGRMLDWVRAEQAVIDDVLALIPNYVPAAEIDLALAEQLLAESNHSIRRVCVNLDMLRHHAQTEGLTRISKRDWQASGKQFFTGLAPKPRGTK